VGSMRIDRRASTREPHMDQHMNSNVQNQELSNGQEKVHWLVTTVPNL